MNSDIVARASENSDRYSASGLTADETASSGPTRAQHVAFGAARGERHDGRCRDHRDDEHPGSEGGAPLIDPRRPAREAHPAGCRRTTQRPHPPVATAPRQPQQARKQTRDAGRGLDGRGDRRRTDDSGALTVVRPKNSPNETIASAMGTAPDATGNSATTAAGPRSAHEEHDEGGHEQIAVRADGQVDRHEVFPREQRAGGDVGETPANSSGLPRRDGTASGIPSTKRAITRSPATRQPPQRRLQASAAIAAATAAEPDQEQERQSR